MITGGDIVKAAENSGLLGTPYSKLDCQALVEDVLKKAGLHIPNYRGSNHMWRDLVYDRTPIVNKNESGIPAGALVFIVRHDGGEVKRGYHDKDGNATHVAIYMGNGKVFESTTGGVQYNSVSRFTDFGKIKGVEYTTKDTAGGGGNDHAGEGQADKLKLIQSILETIREELDRLEDIYNETF